jgi:hypothetical protein
MKLDRRFMLRGTCQGALAVMGLPFLDCFLDSKGKALAATGKALPNRFATFFWGCGLTTQLWVPKIAGKDYEMTVQLKPLEAFRGKLTAFSGARVMSEGGSGAHYAYHTVTGGGAAENAKADIKTIDLQIADAISHGTRFKTIAAAASGDPSQCYSSLGGVNKLSAEASPQSLYTRLFGPGFQDPTKGDWKPEPRVMLQQSVLSAVADMRKDIMLQLGTGDRARMDQYFTSVREAELQVAAELQRPEIIAKVAIPDMPPNMICNNSWPNLQKSTPIMARLGAIAMATDQTRVFNLSISEPQNQMFIPGDSLGYHQTTHEDPIDPILGYQKRVAAYNLQAMELFADMLKEMDGIPEGDGTLLDHMLIMAHTDSSYAKIHAVDGLPVFLVGGANGKWKSGSHVATGGSPVSRIGLTVLRAMGVATDTWGAGPMVTKSPFTELLA